MLTIDSITDKLKRHGHSFRQGPGPRVTLYISNGWTISQVATPAGLVWILVEPATPSSRLHRLDTLDDLDRLPSAQGTSPLQRLTADLADALGSVEEARQALALLRSRDGADVPGAWRVELEEAYNSGGHRRWDEELADRLHLHLQRVRLKMGKKRVSYSTHPISAVAYRRLHAAVEDLAQRAKLPVAKAQKLSRARIAARWGLASTVELPPTCLREAVQDELMALHWALHHDLERLRAVLLEGAVAATSRPARELERLPLMTWARMYRVQPAKLKAAAVELYGEARRVSQDELVELLRLTLPQEVVEAALAGKADPRQRPQRRTAVHNKPDPRSFPRSYNDPEYQRRFDLWAAQEGEQRAKVERENGKLRRAA